MRLIQYMTDTGARGVARIDGNRAIAVKGAASTVALAQQAIAARRSLDDAVKAAGDGEALDYPALLSQRRVLLVSRISGLCLIGGGAWLALARAR